MSPQEWLLCMWVTHSKCTDVCREKKITIYLPLKKQVSVRWHIPAPKSIVLWTVISIGTNHAMQAYVCVCYDCMNFMCPHVTHRNDHNLLGEPAQRRVGFLLCLTVVPPDLIAFCYKKSATYIPSYLLSTLDNEEQNEKLSAKLQCKDREMHVK